MSFNPAPARSSKSKKARERERERSKNPAPAGAERLKTVVRRLPPNLPEEIFWHSVQEWVSDDTTSWKTYYMGKLKRRLNKENIPSRAYIAFKSPEMVSQFARAFDGHLFKDKAGNESIAVVEFAPYQKVPTEKKKPDARIASIEKDEDFISFVESLNAPTEALTIEQLLSASQPVPQPKTTPLLEALKAERERIKDKEIIVRSIQQAPKKDLKKGLVVPPASVKQEPLSKKASKAAKKAAGTANAATPSTSSTVPPLSNPPPKAPKAPRAMRQQQQAIAPPQILTAKSQSSPPIPQSASAAGPTPRRVRPVLGLGSRQFEAALVGVGGRKRDDKEIDSPSQALPGSPKTQKNTSEPLAPVKVPSILKRSPVVATKPLEETQTEGLLLRGHGPRRGRQGRGRGRGGFTDNSRGS